MINDEEFDFAIESDDDTRIALIVTSRSGRKISLQDFVAVLEGWIHEVTQADDDREKTKSQNH
jgi:hypothetical protein